ncbi:NRDE family protein [Microbulbifer celer]|uniref:NRDE family protein n=1 Tax=Microbulbifer celer TaxID=435905 RepID=A0ABW3U9X2_9GAMM|nr:NRDE family protein [Microbulbifer celer]UFN57421.1 NRDE family protein [Microbulbifer celer]
MCLLLFAYRQHPRYPLILLANRDEFYQRPTAPADLWHTPPIVAGRDLEAGGTWLGATDGGRLAAVTNVREPGVPTPPAAASRGDIPTKFLAADNAPLRFAETLAGERYRGFNAMLYDPAAPESLICAGNRHRPFAMTSGVHGISNGAADAPWPKVTRGRESLAQLVQSLPHNAPPEWLLAPSLALLQDTAVAEDSALPDTGVGLEMERALAPIFVRIPAGNLREGSSGYGTRASTLVLSDREGRVYFWEQSYREGQPLGSPRHFTIPSTTASVTPRAPS